MLSNIRVLALLMAVFFTLSSACNAALGFNIELVKDISYGKFKEQTLDVYYPVTEKKNSPVIFMVHGGAWRIGDKGSKSVIQNKVTHWVSKGFILISVNYRMLPKTRPVEQAEDVKKALIFSQKNVDKWGGAADKFILMGHSAGAHLVSLISVDSKAFKRPLLGTIALDSAAYDIEKIMSVKSPSWIYKKAFGTKPNYWQQASPMYNLSKKIPPFLAVCSSQRKDDSCAQATTFVNKAKTLGSTAQLLSLDFSHREVNVELGKDVYYTNYVDEFIRKLHPSIDEILTRQPESASKLK
jgi:acetyl esterase/lipase